MAPATLLNKLLEPVPVLSELLTGGDKAGIVLTEFRLDGNISKPSISFRAFILCARFAQGCF